MPTAAHGHTSYRVLPESLLEPPPLNAEARNAEKAFRQLALCDGLPLVMGLPEPRPDDPRQLTDFATKFRSYLRVIRLSGKVRSNNDPQYRTNNPDEPSAVAVAIRIAQAQMWGYLARVSAAEGFADKTHEPRAALQQSLDTAWLQLANSSFTTAADVLRDAQERLCGGS